MSSIERPHTLPRPGLLARLGRSKVSELLHGRISPGITPAQLIASSGLDEPARALIAEVCRKTGLWNDERCDIARELIAHFHDGAASGASSAQLIRSFGDVRQAAKLIRRSKVRGRSTLWHILRFLRRATAALVLIYTGLAVYFSLGTPRVSVDYVAKLNEPVLGILPEERAWPFYRDLAERFDAEPNAMEISPNVSPTKWPEVVRWIEDHADTLTLLDQATARPALGFVYGAEGSARELTKLAKQQGDPNDPFYNALITVLLPQLNYMRRNANILASDARLAAEQNDAERWLKRTRQIHRMGEHSRIPGILISHLVQIGIESIRLEQIQRMLVDHPGLLSDRQLAELAHDLALYHKPSDLLSYDGERMMFQDIVQRIYTDDGNGNGYLSLRGISNLQRIEALPGPPGTQDEWSALSELAKFAAAPPAAMLMASRKDLITTYDHYMDQLELNMDVPWRERRNESIEDQISVLKESRLLNIRYLLITQLLPALDRASNTAERLLTSRDATQVGIALELYRRRDGTYPATLEELTPALLPSVPVDPADGSTLRYRVVDGKPLVYSVGVDLDDDNGTFANAGRAGGSGSNAMAIGNTTDERYSGDWILYPQPRAAAEEDEEAVTAE